MAGEGGISPSSRVLTDVINVKHHEPYMGTCGDVNVKDTNSTGNSEVFLCTTVVRTYTYITLKLHNVTICMHFRIIYNVSHGTTK